MAKRNHKGQFVKRSKYSRKSHRTIRAGGVEVLTPRKRSRYTRRRASGGGGGGLVRSARGFVSPALLIGTGAAVLAGGIATLVKSFTLDRIDFFKTNKIGSIVGTVGLGAGLYWAARRFLPKYATAVAIGLLYPILSGFIAPLWAKVTSSVAGLGAASASAPAHHALPSAGARPAAAAMSVRPSVRISN